MNLPRTFPENSRTTPSNTSRHLLGEPWPGCEVDYSFDLPAEYDWRKRNTVNPKIKNQGDCGICWIFAAVGVMEAAYTRNGLRYHSDYPPISLSEQYYLNCYTESCYGGFAHLIFKWAQQVGGIVWEEQIPYEFRAERCGGVYPSGTTRDGPLDWCRALNLDNEEQLQRIIYRDGPAAVAVHAPEYMANLKGPFEDECTSRQNGYGTHEVVAVGWTRDYWLLKNSWGHWWGVDGYLYLKRSNAVNEREGGNCAILTQAEVATFNTSIPH